jgi:two-component system, NtrC family, sensor histidine kinase GlrK
MRPTVSDAATPPSQSAQQPAVSAARRWYPRSFFGFLILAFALVCAPLVLSLVRLALEANELSAGTSVAVRKVAAVLQDVEALEQATTRMERLVLQSVALGEPVAADALEPAHQQFVQAAQHLLNAAPGDALTQSIKAISEAEATLVAQVRAQPRLSAPPPELDRINQDLQPLFEAGSRLAALEVAALQTASATTRRDALLALAVALPGALLLALGFTVALARPMHRVENAIRAMGAGRLDDTIQIGGPSDVRQLGMRLDWLRGRLKDLEGHRDLLTRSISHDLKTPLTSMVEGLALLRQEVAGPLNPQQAEVLTIMRESAQQLSDKIEGLLQVRTHAQQDSQRDAPVTLRRVALRELTLSVVSRHRLVAQGRQLRVQVQGDELFVSADQPKLDVVLDNLLSNAIRFSPPAGAICIEVQPHPERPQHARITVSDDGPGVAMADRDRVFDPGYRGDAQPAQSVAGSGQGLSIARDFVLAHGGSLTVLPPGSGPRKGASFCLVLPAVLPAVVAAPAAPRDTATHESA